jgi:hypothetical protein
MKNNKMSINDLPKDVLYKIITHVNLSCDGSYSYIDLLNQCWTCKNHKIKCTHISIIEKDGLYNLRMSCQRWNYLIKTRYGHYSFM